MASDSDRVISYPPVLLFYLSRLWGTVLGCYVSRVYVGCTVYADDMILTSSCVNMLQEMLTVLSFWIYWVTWLNRSDLVLRPNSSLRPNLHKFFKWRQAFGLILKISPEFVLISTSDQIYCLKPNLMWTNQSNRQLHNVKIQTFAANL